MHYAEIAFSLGVFNAACSSGHQSQGDAHSAATPTGNPQPGVDGHDDQGGPAGLGPSDARRRARCRADPGGITACLRRPLRTGQSPWRPGRGDADTRLAHPVGGDWSLPNVPIPTRLFPSAGSPDPGHAQCCQHQRRPANLAAPIGSWRATAALRLSGTGVSPEGKKKRPGTARPQAPYQHTHQPLPAGADGRVYSGSVASRPSSGAPVPDDPMKNFEPSSNVTSRPLARALRSLLW